MSTSGPTCTTVDRPAGRRPRRAGRSRPDRHRPRPRPASSITARSTTGASTRSMLRRNSTVFQGPGLELHGRAVRLSVTNVTATASSASRAWGRRTRSTAPDSTPATSTRSIRQHMWLSTGVQPNWIQYRIRRCLQAVRDCGSGTPTRWSRPIVGFGAKDVTIEYSVDGSTWTVLAGVPEFARAPAQPAYAPNTLVDFGGVLAKYVKLTDQQHLGRRPRRAGLSEVRFFYVPVQARAPTPAAGATGVDSGRRV